MHRFRIACVVGTWMLAAQAQAQHAPLIQVAAEIEFAPATGESEMRVATESLGVSMPQSDANSWVLTDDSIDALALTPISETGCECGAKHCHGVCRDPGHPKKPLFTKPGDRDRGDCPPLRYRMNDCERAGNPHCYHRWAKCSVDEKYSAWFVGGGSPFCFARGRTSEEGTWGLDYGGFFGHAKVWLNYSHGRPQGGEGAYRTDGEPKIVSRAHDLLHLGH